MVQSSDAYRVVCSEAIRRQLKLWGDRARASGTVKEYVEALKSIEAPLCRDPLTWGDPLYHFSQFDMLVCRGIHGPLLVEYGVNQAERVVFVREYRLLPNAPFSQRQ